MVDESSTSVGQGPGDRLQSAAGQQGRREHLVTLYVSTGAAPVAVPSVVGQQESAAEPRCSRASMSRSRPTRHPPSRRARWSARARAAAPPPPGSTVTISVSGGAVHGALGHRRFAATASQILTTAGIQGQRPARAAARPSTATAPCSTQQPGGERHGGQGIDGHHLRPERRDADLRRRPPRPRRQQRQPHRPRVRPRRRRRSRRSADPPAVTPSGYAWVPHRRASPGRPRTPHDLVSRRPPCPSPASASGGLHAAAAESARKKVSPPWLGPAILACLVIGLAWIAVYYVTQGSFPGMSALGAWNLVVGLRVHHRRRRPVHQVALRPARYSRR